MFLHDTATSADNDDANNSAILRVFSENSPAKNFWDYK